MGTHDEMMNNDDVDVQDDYDDANHSSSKHWICCLCCRGKHIYDKWMSNTSSNQNKTTTEKAKEALIYEECLDAATSKLVENSCWANATLIIAALKETVWIEFNSSDYNEE